MKTVEHSCHIALISKLPHLHLNEVVSIFVHSNSAVVANGRVFFALIWQYEPKKQNKSK